jgi:ferredoxin
LKKLINTQGGKLAAGFTVNMPNNMAGHSINNPERQKKMLHVWNENSEFIIAQINSRKKINYNTPNVLVGKLYWLIRFVVSPLIFLFKPLTLNHLKRYSDSSKYSYTEMLPFMDRSFYDNGKCVACGSCINICPVGNIELVNNLPEWQHHCEFCLACFHWCPKEAIESQELKETVRYHHPEITLSDMIQSVE